MENNSNIIYDSIIELGGFAEEPKDVSDAWTEEEMQRDFECFNFCLAENYVSAMYNENFEELGYMDGSLILTISRWINYKESLGNENLAKEISEGTLLTKNNRTFIETIVANKIYDYAYSYILIGVYHPSLIHLLMEGYANGLEYYCPISGVSQERFNEINSDLYDEIEKNYQASDDKIAYLNMIKKGIGAIRFDSGLKQKPIPKSLSWGQTLKNMNKGKE